MRGCHGVLTGDEIVKKALCPEWELADKGEPGQQPSRELLREDGPVECCLTGAAQRVACLVRQSDSIFGIVHGPAKPVGSASDIPAGPERIQAFGKVGLGGD